MKQANNAPFWVKMVPYQYVEKQKPSGGNSPDEVKEYELLYNL